MKANITILAVTLAGLSQLAANVYSQQPVGTATGVYAQLPAGYPAPQQAAVVPTTGYPMANQAGMVPPGGYPGPGPAATGPVAGYPVPGGAYATLPVNGYDTGGAIQPVPSGGYGEPSMPMQGYGTMQPYEPMASVGGYAPSGGCDDCGDAGCDGACGGGGMLSKLFCGSGLGIDSGYPHPARIWGGVEYLYWWNKDRTVPVLATTSVAGTPFNQAGVLGLPSTSILFGGGGYDDEGTSGVRGTLGYWLDSNQTLGVFARAYQLGAEEINFAAESSGSPILARPFFNIDTGLEDSLVVAYPGLSRGRIGVDTENTIRGYDVLVRKMLYYGECNRIDFVGGYQSTQIDDSVRVSHWLISEDPQGRVPVGTRIDSADLFEAENEFHGGVIGLMAQGYDGRFTWNLLTKVAFGNTKETLSIRGSSTTTVPGAGSATTADGLLALGTNTGVYEQDEFTIVPELDLSVMYQLTSQLQVSIGYTALFWTNALMAGEAIDLGVNPTQIGAPLIGAARPAYTAMQDDDFWAQGLTFGLHGRF